MDRLIEEFRASNAKATLKDIARITGLSLSAVSQALNPSAKSTIGLSDKSVEKAREVAKKINYRTHWGAVSVRSNFLYNVAYLKVENEGDIVVSSPFLASFCKEAKANNFAVTVLSVDGETKSLPALFKNNRLDGIVIDHTKALPTKLQAELNGSNIPTVNLNKRGDVNAVYSDEVQAASEICNFLIERGNSKILFLKPDTKASIFEHYSIGDRERGYLKAMREAKLPSLVKSIEIEKTHAFNQRIDMSWLDFDELPHAILAYSDDLANSIAKVFYRKGIKIPREISLAGFEGGLSALSAWCPLSTMRVPYKEMGKSAFEMLLELIKSANKQGQKAISFKTSLIIGESTK